MESITSDEFVRKVLTKPFALVDFYSTRCIPCRAMAANLDKLDKEYPDVSFTKVNTDEETEVADYYQVQTVPTVILFKEGELQEMLTGMHPINEVRDMLDKVVTNS